MALIVYIIIQATTPTYERICPDCPICKACECPDCPPSDCPPADCPDCPECEEPVAPAEPEPPSDSCNDDWIIDKIYYYITKYGPVDEEYILAYHKLETGESAICGVVSMDPEDAGLVPAENNMKNYLFKIEAQKDVVTTNEGEVSDATFYSTTAPIQSIFVSGTLAINVQSYLPSVHSAYLQLLNGQLGTVDNLAGLEGDEQEVEEALEYLYRKDILTKVDVQGVKVYSLSLGVPSKRKGLLDTYDSRYRDLNTLQRDIYSTLKDRGPLTTADLAAALDRDVEKIDDEISEMRASDMQFVEWVKRDEPAEDMYRAIEYVKETSRLWPEYD